MISRMTSLANTPGISRPRHADAAHLQRIHRQALRREHVAHLRRADAERHRAERAMRRRMAVAAGDRHPRLRQPQLRPDDVHDPLRAAGQIEHRHAGCCACSARAPRACPRPSRRRTAAAGRASGRCGRRWPPSAPDTARPARAPAACRTPAGSSPRGSDAGRRRAASARSAACGRCGGPRLS